MRTKNKYFWKKATGLKSMMGHNTKNHTFTPIEICHTRRRWLHPTEKKKEKGDLHFREVTNSMKKQRKEKKKLLWENTQVKVCLILSSFSLRFDRWKIRGYSFCKVCFFVGLFWHLEDFSGWCLPFVFRRIFFFPFYSLGCKLVFLELIYSFNCQKIHE